MPPPSLPPAPLTLQFKGTGTVDGLPGTFHFMIWVTDEDKAGGVDHFRIKLWKPASGSEDVLYDNKAATGDNDDFGTALGGGNIVVHSAKKGGN